MRPFEYDLRRHNKKRVTTDGGIYVKIMGFHSHHCDSK
ncbi:hypothetical protein Golob_008283 [Gossypium lobatum]|uniref:Uncharacterized protein n=1 Tax=Gossypium lobatum TaxID=34289 RepID=A0A7J8MEZ6_9ROSI|nr:hypothetical protein [Gossypium lobatum]